MLFHSIKSFFSNISNLDFKNPVEYGSGTKILSFHIFSSFKTDVNTEERNSVWSSTVNVRPIIQGIIRQEKNVEMTLDSGLFWNF